MCVPSVHLQKTVYARSVGIGLHLDGIEGDTVPDAVGKHGDPLLIDPFSRIDVFIQDNCSEGIMVVDSAMD